MSANESTGEFAVDCVDLHYAFQEGLESALRGATVQLPKGARCLLVGANGAGKSTLLRILAGKRLTKSEHCRILGSDVFQKPHTNVVYLGTEWSTNPVVRSDIVVQDFLDSVGGYRHKERRDKLLDILDVDLDWHMHQISDGERRRVQLCMGLMGDWDVLLLDEVTVDLDVLVRSNLIDFLMEESETRGATVIYATHIFDGLNKFPTHISHLQLGATPEGIIHWKVPDETAGAQTLFSLALEWIRTDTALRREQDRARGKVRGARKGDTRDAKTFFEKYDYSH